MRADEIVMSVRRTLNLTEHYARPAPLAAALWGRGEAPAWRARAAAATTKERAKTIFAARSRCGDRKLKKSVRGLIGVRVSEKRKKDSKNQKLSTLSLDAQAGIISWKRLHLDRTPIHSDVTLYGLGCGALRA